LRNVWDSSEAIRSEFGEFGALLEDQKKMIETVVAKIESRLLLEEFKMEVAFENADQN
jgi:hypothetical protein